MSSAEAPCGAATTSSATWFDEMMAFVGGDADFYFGADPTDHSGEGGCRSLAAAATVANVAAVAGSVALPPATTARSLPFFTRVALQFFKEGGPYREMALATVERDACLLKVWQATPLRRQLSDLREDFCRTQPNHLWPPVPSFAGGRPFLGYADFAKYKLQTASESAEYSSRFAQKEQADKEFRSVRKRFREVFRLPQVVTQLEKIAEAFATGDSFQYQALPPNVQTVSKSDAAAAEPRVDPQEVAQGDEAVSSSSVPCPSQAASAPPAPPSPEEIAGFVSAYETFAKAKYEWTRACPLHLAAEAVERAMKEAYAQCGVPAAEAKLNLAEKRRGRESQADGKSLEVAAFRSTTTVLAPEVLAAFHASMIHVDAQLRSNGETVVASRPAISPTVVDVVRKIVRLFEQGEAVAAALILRCHAAMENDKAAILRLLADRHFPAGSKKQQVVVLEVDAPAAAAVESHRVTVESMPSLDAIRADATTMWRFCLEHDIPFLSVAVDVEVRAQRVAAQLDGAVVDLMSLQVLYVGEVKHSPADIVYANKQRRRMEAALCSETPITLNVPQLRDGGKLPKGTKEVQLQRHSFELFLAFPVALWGYITRRDLKAGDIPVMSKLTHHCLNSVCSTCVTEMDISASDAADVLVQKLVGASSRTNVWDAACTKMRKEWAKASAPEGDYNIGLLPPSDILREVAAHGVTWNVVRVQLS